MRVVPLLLLWPTLAFATTVATPPAGYFRLSAAAGSDTSLVLPLITRSVGVAHIVNATTNDILLDLPGVADGQFSPGPGGSYYVQIRSGSLAGLMYRITSSSGNRLRLDSRGSDLGRHPLGSLVTGAEGDIVCIRRCATIRETLETTTALAVTPVTGLAFGAYEAGDALFVPTDGGTFAPERLTIVYLAGAGWRKVGDLINDVGDTALFPGLAFTVRAGAQHDVEFVSFGYVPTGRFAVELAPTADGEPTDFHVGLINATNVPLQDSGLLTDQADATPIRASINDDALADVVLSWTNGRIGMDRPPTVRHYVVGESWYRAGLAAGAETLKAGTGYVLRLRGGRSPRFWIQEAN